MNQLFSTFKEDFQCEHAIPVGSGTTGLALILNAIQAKGKKVIIPAMTCPNVVIAVYAAGAIPLVVDVSYSDANVSVDSIRNAMDHDVAAVVAVNMFGYPTNIPKIQNIADLHNCYVIEDACQAYGGTTKNKPIGGRGAAGVISFGFKKPVELKGGGMIFSNDKVIADRIRCEIQKIKYKIFFRLKNKFAIYFMLKGKNNLLNKLANIGLYQYQFPRNYNALYNHWHQFKKNKIKLKNKIYNITEILNRLPGVEPFEYHFENWLPWRYSFKVPDPDYRDYFIHNCKRINLRVSQLYKPVTYHFKNLITKGSLTNAKNVSQSIFNLKYDMNLKNIDEFREQINCLERML